MAKRKRSKYPGLTKPDNSPFWQYRFMLNGVRVSESTGEVDVERAWDRACEIREAAKLAAKDKFAKHRTAPIDEHVEAWRAGLVAAGDTPLYISMVVGRCKAVIAGAKFRTWADVTRPGVEQFLNSLRDKDAKVKNKTVGRGYGTRTRNGYVRAIKGFCAWMVSSERAPSNPLVGLRCEKGLQADVRRKRRAFTPEEWQELIAYAENGPVEYGVSGTDRARLWRFLGETGLRSNETRTLRWSAIDVDGDPPAVTVAAAFSKTGDSRTVPIRPEFAAVMKGWKAPGQNPFTPAFRMPNRTNVCRMLRRDLGGAREAWIKRAENDSAEHKRRAESSFLVYCSDSGVLDVHSFRHSYASWLARAGVPVKVAQDLLGHKTIALTMQVYSHVLLPDRARALAGALPQVSTQTAARAATSA